MAKIEFDKTFNIMPDDGTIVGNVEGRFTKVKGYSEFTFFSHKMDKSWYIREFHTGRDIGSGISENAAKTDGKALIMKHTNGDKKILQDQIDSLPKINNMDDYND